MSKKLVLLVAVVFSMLVSACSKGDDKKSGNSAPGASQPEGGSLSSKSVEEVLNLKYDRAELKCALWVQISHELNLNVTPNDSFTLDLKNGLTLPQTLGLSGQVENHKLEAKFDFNSISILAGLHHTDVDGTVTDAKNTPILEYAITAQSKTTFDGEKSSGMGFYENKREAKERIRDVIVNDSSYFPPVTQDGVTIDKGSYRNYIECTLETEIKPEYQDELRIEKKN